MGFGPLPLEAELGLERQTLFTSLPAPMVSNMDFLAPSRQSKMFWEAISKRTLWRAAGCPILESHLIQGWDSKNLNNARLQLTREIAAKRLANLLTRYQAG